MSTEPTPPYVDVTMAHADARALYEHLGTMPWAPGSWSNNLRAELSEVLHFASLNGGDAQ